MLRCSLPYLCTITAAEAEPLLIYTSFEKNAHLWVNAKFRHSSRSFYLVSEQHLLLCPEALLHGAVCSGEHSRAKLSCTGHCALGSTPEFDMGTTHKCLSSTCTKYNIHSYYLFKINKMSICFKIKSVVCLTAPKSNLLTYTY